MGELFTPAQLGANDLEDMVEIKLGSLRPLIPYQTALTVAAELRMACKHAARFNGALSTFWRDVDVEDLDDCPEIHHQFRRSQRVPNCEYQGCRRGVKIVGLVFSGLLTEMTYEDGIKLHVRIRRAARRAKAWAGDTFKYRHCYGNITDAAEDDRLGLP